MAPNTLPATPAHRPPLWRAIPLFVALLMMAPAATAQLPSVPDLQVGSGIDTPIGSADVGTDGSTIHACADAYADADQVTALAPALPVAIPSTPGVAGDACADAAIPDAQAAAEDLSQDLPVSAGDVEGHLAKAQQKASTYVQDVKDFLDDTWSFLTGLF